MHDPIDLTLRSGDSTSQALVEGAHRLLVSGGITALTVRRIAQEAGMSTMNVYSRFGGKDGVLRTLLMSGHRALQRELDAVPLGGELADDLRSLADAYRRFALSNPSYFRLMFLDDLGVPDWPDSAHLAPGTVGVVAAAIEAALADEPSGADLGGAAIEIAAAFVSACTGLVLGEMHQPLDTDAGGPDAAGPAADRFRLGVGMMTAGLSAGIARPRHAASVAP